MMHIAIGTKAQFIKMAPIMLELKKRGEKFVLQDMAQHKGITPEIREIFNITDIPRHEVVQSDTNASSIFGIFSWSLKFLKILSLGKHAYADKTKLIKQKELVLVHGDTLSTLYGALLAKRMGAKVILIEAGLTSHKLFNPFPEEIVRRFVQRLSNICFCPGNTEFERMQKRFPKKTIVNTNYNTGRDAVKFILPDFSGNEMSKAEETNMKGSYILCTIHRFETISSVTSIKRMVDYIDKLAASGEQVVFCLHEPTEKYLKKFSQFSRLHSNSNILVTPLQPYNKFIRLINGAKIVITDGGSIQEECYTLSKPCVIFREATERNDGLGTNAVLTKFDSALDRADLDSLKIQKQPQHSYNMRATDIVVDTLSGYI